ncbi:MAG: hypothetical protein AAB656_02340 [Patescibacteria group bacterium]
MPKELLQPDTETLKKTTIGGWEFNYLEKGVVFPKSAVESVILQIPNWSRAFPKEETWIQKNHNLPSLIIRVDAAVNDGNLFLYEIEERPAGIGITYTLNKDFRNNLDDIRTTWPDFEVLVSPERKGSDDFLWTDVTSQANGKPLLIRAEPEESQYHHLEPQSISSLRKKGHKGYGVEMGLWNHITSPDQLDWMVPFVVKPLQGSKTRNVVIWHPDKLPGSHTRTKITNAISNNPNGVYVQPFCEPSKINIEGEDLWLLHRVYFGYDLDMKEWRFLGGLWNARNNLKIHGASDSVFGPTEEEK